MRAGQLLGRNDLFIAFLLGQIGRHHAGAAQTVDLQGTKGQVNRHLRARARHERKLGAAAALLAVFQQTGESLVPGGGHEPEKLAPITF